jgi:hypothetical protein
MESLVHALLGNALAVTFLAGLVAGLSRVCRRPALIHSLWLLVLLKLVTPPFVLLKVPSASSFAPMALRTVAAFPDHDKIAASQSEELPLVPADIGTSARGDSLAHGKPIVPSGSEDACESSPELEIADSPALAGAFTFTLPPGWKWEHLVLILVGADLPFAGNHLYVA